MSHSRLPGPGALTLRAVVALNQQQFIACHVPQNVGRCMPTGANLVKGEHVARADQFRRQTHDVAVFIAARLGGPQPRAGQLPVSERLKEIRHFIACLSVAIGPPGRLLLARAAPSGDRAQSESRITSDHNWC